MNKKEIKKHNLRWFTNRIGKKIYCDDHPKGNIDWTECDGIIIEREESAFTLMKNQERGINFQ